MRKYKLKLNDKDFEVQLNSVGAEDAVLEINGKEFTVAISAIEEVLPEGAELNLAAVAAAAPVASAKPKVAAAGDGSVLAPIPGSIMQVYVKVGDEVKVGQALFKMEAMKMENEINARVDGKVCAVNIKVGDSVNQGDELIVID